MKKIALALGSGGARGYAHIGVIRELIERDYEIVAISGTSMGALVGALYCTQAMERYADWVASLDYLGVLKLLDLSWDQAGAIKGERVMAALRDLMGDLNIEDLPIPYTAVAADLHSQKEVWFQSGPLDLAVRASISMPGLFTPVPHHQGLLVDGGILNPVPVSPLQSVHHADLVMAVNVTSDQGQATLEQQMPDYFAPKQVEQKQSNKGGIAKELRQRATSLMERMAWKEDAVGQKRSQNWGKIDIIMQSFDVTQASLGRFKLAGSPPDLQIDISKHTLSSFDFHRAKPMIELGQRLAAQTLDDYESAP